MVVEAHHLLLAHSLRDQHSHVLSCTAMDMGAEGLDGCPVRGLFFFLGLFSPLILFILPCS